MSVRRCSATSPTAQTVVSSTGTSTLTPRGTQTNAPPRQEASLAAVKASTSDGTTVPRYGSTSSGCSATATSSGRTTGPSSTAAPSDVAASTCSSSTAPSGTASTCAGSTDGSGTPPAGGNASGENDGPSGVNSHPSSPLNDGSGSFKPRAR